jgi:hypothetical protein
MTALVIAEHDNANVKGATLNATVNLFSPIQAAATWPVEFLVMSR